MWRTALGFNFTEYQDFDAAENTIQNIVDQSQNEIRTNADGSTQPWETAPLEYNLACPLFQDLGLATSPSNCSTAQDLAGRRLDNAPRWTFSTSLHYEVPIFNLPFKWMFHTDYSFRSTIFLNQDLDPNLKEPDLHLLDFRTGLKSDEGLMDGRIGWELVFWVRNTLDEQYNATGFDVPVLGGFAAIHGPPRQFGGTIRLIY
jgi:outer membrane receptor protein involved in Fe transport